MKDSIVVKLPYPHKLLGLTLMINRTIGFTFTNLASFYFREKHNILNSEDYKRFIKEQGESGLVIAMMYASALAYCSDTKQKVNFTEDKIAIAVASASPEIKQQIVNCWKHSQIFGLVEGKKKTTRMR